MPKIFKVGGCVRDRLLGVATKDIDFTFVLDNLDRTVEEGFNIMTEWLKHHEFEIFLSTPECFTIRAKFPKKHQFEGLVADFVLARKEVGYVEGTRRPILVLGTLEDDLIRRDFTVNAMAEDENGTIIDLFNGQSDLRKGVLKTPLNPEVTFNDDPLRILRAIRFCITKHFFIESNIDDLIRNFDYSTKMGVVSDERIREELYKCFKFNTIKTLKTLNDYPSLRNYIFRDNKLWLKPTFEKI